MPRAFITLSKRIAPGVRIGVGASKRLGSPRKAAQPAAPVVPRRPPTPAERVGGYIFLAGIVSFFAGFAFPPLFAVAAFSFPAGLIYAAVLSLNRQRRERRAAE